MDDVMERLAALEAKEAIRECLYRYARAVDRCDVEMLKTVYHPDAIDVHGGVFAGNGHEFCEYIVPMMSAAIVNRHLITNPLIELDGNRAFVESQYVSTHRVAVDDERAADIYGEGRYLDVFEERDGEWKLLHRLVIGEKWWTRESAVQGTAPEINGVRATVGALEGSRVLGFRHHLRVTRAVPRSGPDAGAQEPVCDQGQRLIVTRWRVPRRSRLRAPCPWTRTTRGPASRSGARP